MTDAPGHFYDKKARPISKRFDWLTVYAIVVMVFLFLPIALIVLFSFHSTPSLAFPFKGLSLRWYREVFIRADLIPALFNSLIVGGATTLISMTLGVLAGLGLTRSRSRFASIVGALTSLPILMPGLFLGVALLSLFAMLKIHLSLQTVVIGHTIYTIPYFILVIRSRLERFDLMLEEASRDLGANRFQTFRLVTFPIIRSSVVGASLLVFALSFDEFLITFFIIGSDSTLPMLIWSMLRRTINPSVNAVATMILTFSLILILVGNRLADLKTSLAERKMQMT
jgi:ABC-type spermidine/putrescine transport system permease subunit II